MENFLIAARAVHYASTISLAGVFAFRCFVSGPEASPRLRRQLSLVGWASLVLALLSGGAWLLFVSAQMSGQPIAATLTQGVAETVLNRTRFGQIWVLRFVLATILAGLLVIPQGWRGWLWRGGGLALSAAVLASLAWAGHGGATPGQPGNLHLAADMLHLLAAGAWVGSLIPLALLLAEARSQWQSRRGSGSARGGEVFAPGRHQRGGLARRRARQHLVSRRHPTGVVGTEYGRLLLLKIAIFATMAAVRCGQSAADDPASAPIAGRGVRSSRPRSAICGAMP